MPTSAIGPQQRDPSNSAEFAGELDLVFREAEVQGGVCAEVGDGNLGWLQDTMGGLSELALGLESA